MKGSGLHWGKTSYAKFRGGRAFAASFIALYTLSEVTSANGQQVTPFGDVPASIDFSEAEIAARGRQPARDLTYSDWTKLCFKGVHGAEAFESSELAVPDPSGGDAPSVRDAAKSTFPQ